MPAPFAILAARALQAALVAVVVGVFSFVMMQSLPGDAAYRIAAGRYGYDIMDGAAADAVRRELGLDRPWSTQLLDWLTALSRFDLGNSLVSGSPVVEEISHQLGASLLLAGTAIGLSVLIAVPVGVICGLRPHGALDRAVLALSIGLRAVPAFALGVVLVLLFSIQLRLLPVAGYGGVQHLVLPSLTLALGLAAVSNRVIRDAVLRSVQSEWFRFARIKGLNQRTALIHHVLRNAAVPSIAYVGVQFAYLIEGVVIVEAVFAWPGIGHALVHAIFERDVTMVQGTALTLGLLYVALNVAVDFACRAVDPRSPEKRT